MGKERESYRSTGKAWVKREGWRAERKEKNREKET